jgi:putative protease
MPFDLVDADGNVIEHDRHLLSLRDLNLSDHLEALAEAGATSFKIEGRLKDISYVKNVTAFYSERLNDLVRRHPDHYTRASQGQCRYTFQPDLSRTFNRGYTTYFAHGRQPDIASFDTPKAIGQRVGTVKELRRDSFSVAGTASFANGDGLCFFRSDRQLVGFRVNRVEGNRLYPQHMPQGLRPGLPLYRSSDQAMERLLSRPSAERKVSVAMRLRATADGFSLQLDNDRPVTLVAEHQPADKPQHDNIVRQLSRLGGTPFECSEVDLPPDFNYFIPSSLLADLRRRAVAQRLLGHNCRQQTTACSPLPAAAAKANAPFRANVANREAARFYGDDTLDAYELQPRHSTPLMQCRHCLRYTLGFCVRRGGRRPTWHEPLSLRLADGRTFPLEFDCQHCQMNVYAPSR